LRLDPSSTRVVLALGAVLLVLLAVVAAASRVHHTPGGHAGVHQPPSGVGDYVFSIVAVLLAFGALFLIYLWFSQRDLLMEQHRRTQGKRKTLKLVFVLFLFILVLTSLHRLFPGLFSGFHRLRLPFAKVHAGAPAPSGHHGIAGTAAQRAPTFQWLPVVVATAAGVMLLGFIGLRTLRRSRKELGAMFLLEQELESLLDDTLDDLYAQQDPRVAIVAAYARMERIFETYGVPRAPSEAPMEYLGRALRELDATGAALGRLTGLFQWAKFSSHPVTMGMRDDAIAALSEVRDELRRKRVATAANRAEAERFRRERDERRGDEPRDERTFGEDPFKAAEEKMRGSVLGRRGI
jgi:succinate dehydrogenase hydrophobic anchor subunit